MAELLRLDDSLIRVGKEILIRVPSEQVKNSVDLDYRVPRESTVLINFYIKKLLPLLGPNPNGWLFPGEAPERHKCGEQLGRQFTGTIRDMTGIYLYPHLTRHFGAFLYLQENPGAFEVVRRVLAHKSLTTTTRSYAAFDDDSAVRLFDSLILRMRDAINREVTDDGQQ